MSDPTMIYPSSERKSRWESRCRQMGYHSLSTWIQDMTEAGMSKFDVDVTLDEDTAELRQQRTELQQQLQQCRQRTTKLEQQLYNSEKYAIIDFVEDNDGATYDEIVRHVADSVPLRIRQQLDLMDEVKETNGTYVID